MRYSASTTPHLAALGALEASLRRVVIVKPASVGKTDQLIDWCRASQSVIERAYRVPPALLIAQR